MARKTLPRNHAADNDRVARNMESAHRTSLAKGEVGIREKPQAPTLADFLNNTLLPWAETTFGTTTPNGLKWYRNECEILCGYEPLAKTKLDEITGELVNQFATSRKAQGKKVATVNSSIRVLRRAMSYAVGDAGLSFIVPKLKVLPGAAQREPAWYLLEETKYLAAAPEPLKSFATVLVDSGLRPDETLRLRLEDVIWRASRRGTLRITSRKNRSRSPHRADDARASVVLCQTRWQDAGQPQDGWVWPAKKAKAGHMVPNSGCSSHTWKL